MVQYVLAVDFDGTCLLRSKKALCQNIDEGILKNTHGKELDALRVFYQEKITTGTCGIEDELSWMRQSLELYIRAGLSREAVREVLGKLPMRDNFKDLSIFCEQNHIKIAIVSFGIKQFIEAVLEGNNALGLVDEIYAADLLFDESGRACGYKEETLVVGHNKWFFSELFAQKHGVADNRIFALGDSLVDRYLSPYEDNRCGVAETDNECVDLFNSGHFETVTKTTSFLPVVDWLKRKIQ